jgi:hypothetical protein
MEIAIPQNSSSSAGDYKIPISAIVAACWGEEQIHAQPSPGLCQGDLNLLITAWRVALRSGMITRVEACDAVRGGTCRLVGHPRQAAGVSGRVPRARGRAERLRPESRRSTPFDSFFVPRPTVQYVAPSRRRCGQRSYFLIGHRPSLNGHRGPRALPTAPPPLWVFSRGIEYRSRELGWAHCSSSVRSSCRMLPIWLTRFCYPNCYPDDPFVCL